MEYYCTSCGASLDEQDGFDPALQVWSCTQCGTLLMNDEVYEGEIFSGVAWFCDGCNALLNKQEGFSDTLGSWICTECGFESPINESEILNNTDEEFSEKKLIDELQAYDLDYDALHDMPLSQRKQIIEGAGLYYNDYYDLFWDCFDDEEKSCELLNPFADELDSHNIQREREVEISDEEDSQRKLINELQAYDLDYEELHDMPLSQRKQTIEECGLYYDDYYDLFWDCFDDDPEPAQLWEPQSDRVVRKKATQNKNVVYKLKEIKALLLRKRWIHIGLSSECFKGKNVDVIAKALKKKGFININTKPLFDLYIESKETVGSIENIYINQVPGFKEDEEVHFDAEIMIEYHMKRKMILPYSSKVASQKTIDIVQKDLQQLGFTNIYTREINDLPKGRYFKNNYVQNIFVNGDSNYDVTEAFSYDIALLITYYSVD